MSQPEKPDEHALVTRPSLEVALPASEVMPESVLEQRWRVAQRRSRPRPLGVRRAWTRVRPSALQPKDLVFFYRRGARLRYGLASGNAKRVPHAGAIDDKNSSLSWVPLLCRR